MPLSTIDTSSISGLGYGFKNRIINGSMGISQRATSFLTPSTGTYTLDRWLVSWTGAAPASVTQVAGPTGFRNAAQITGAASNTLTQFIQRIESYNCTDLSGATVTIQANIATSSSQTVYWALKYATAQDNFASVTTVSSGTWSATSVATTFTATISSLPSGVLNGLQLEISPNNAGAFTSGTITITGVQLELGTVATSFDWRPYGAELVLCQRYYWRGVGAFQTNAYTTAYVSSGISFPVTMRTTPTINKNGTWVVSVCGQPQAGYVSTNGFIMLAASTGSGNPYCYSSDVTTQYFDTSGAEL